jgi:hypothetical protein
MADDRRDPLDRLRTLLAIVFSSVWLACLPLVLIVPEFPILAVQGPMMLALGWLFLARPRNGGNE